MGLRAPIEVHFPQYTAEQTKILLLQELESRKENIPAASDLKKQFCNLVVRVLFQRTRSFPTLMEATTRLFPKYITPVLKGFCTAGDSISLYERISEDLQQEYNGDMESIGIRCRPPRCRLPMNARFLLGAAFLATSNPQDSDKLIFKKERQFNQNSKIRKNSLRRIRARQKEEKKRRHYTFPVERLFVLYFKLNEGHRQPTAELYSLVSSLVTLQLLDKQGGDALNNPSYSCGLNIDRVEQLVNYPEKLIEFDNYLYYRYL